MRHLNPGILLISLCLSACTSAAPATQPTIAEQTATLHASWRERFKEEKFNALEAPPFLIAGDGTVHKLEAYRDNTIVAAATALKAQYFKTPPTGPILILLFESEEPYKRLAKKWFNDDDVPHYGFYRDSNRTMLMNVGTGTGTLVHELTHALIAPDFPSVPDWFNEGIASLYEQCQIGADHKSITGLTNWRLAGLQKAIKQETLRPLAEMIGDDDFRNEARVGINYAQSRYLMLYLQEKKLLQKYYADFKIAQKDDPKGLETLKKVLGVKSLDAFDKEWRAWVMTLRFE